MVDREEMVMPVVRRSAPERRSARLILELPQSILDRVEALEHAVHQLVLHHPRDLLNDVHRHGPQIRQFPSGVFQCGHPSGNHQLRLSTDSAGFPGSMESADQTVEQTSVSTFDSDERASTLGTTGAVIWTGTMLRVSLGAHRLTLSFRTWRANRSSCARIAVGRM